MFGVAGISGGLRAFFEPWGIAMGFSVVPTIRVKLGISFGVRAIARVVACFRKKGTLITVGRSSGKFTPFT